MFWIVRWVRERFLPWMRGRLFRSGIPLDQPVLVTDRVVTVANGITVVRLLGLPLVVYLALVREQWLSAFALFGLLVFLDTTDGYVARRFNQATRLGATLDPLTDRLTVVTMGVTLVLADVIPVWLAVVVVARDVLLLSLVVVLKRLQRPLPVSQIPVTRMGKLATILLLTGLTFLLLSRADLPASSAVHNGALLVVWAGVVLYYVALGQYLKAGMIGQVRSS
ncbi:CDP-alcohol phosphatidyltransferase family protein [Rhodococcus koreensis]